MPGVGPNMSASQSELLAISITEDLVPSTASKCPSVTSIAFDGLLNPPLLLQDDPTECGGQLWPGGMVLATYLLRTKMTELQDTVCYFCFKKRRRADMSFVKMARKVFEVTDVEDDPDKKVWSRQGIHLYVNHINHVECE
ncbi:MAG: hypothetical protein L6R36_003877 [Xanthoria steineri]|nr:MAG: hypothetical protein L6R36_003877 [Xanthoria steineri]